VPIETWTVGPEYDDAIQSRLKAVLLELGYSPQDQWWGVAGSQEITHCELRGALGNLIVEAETYVGLTVTGADVAVSEVRERIGSMVAKE
jgi:hypothetical protein